MLATECKSATLRIIVSVVVIQTLGKKTIKKKKTKGILKEQEVR